MNNKNKTVYEIYIRMLNDIDKVYGNNGVDKMDVLINLTVNMCSTICSTIDRYFLDNEKNYQKLEPMHKIMQIMIQEYKK